MNRKFVDMFVYILIFLLCAGGATFAHYFPPTAHVPRPAGHAHRKYNTSFTQTLHVMKANSFIRLLPAALLVLGSTTFTACSDDDDNATIPSQELTDADSPTAGQLSRLLNVLSETSDVAEGWATTQYPITEGEADPAHPSVRLVAVASEQEALSYYASLCGEDLPEGTRQHTWSCPGLGSLTYTYKGEPACHATIDVAIAQLSALTQIRLVPASALGNNAAFEPYYHWGDVILNPRDNSYWVCARPASSEYGKSKSYWFSFQLDEDSHTYTVNKEPGLYLPKKLGSTLERTLTLGEMLTLISKPELYTSEYFTLHERPDGLGDICPSDTREERQAMQDELYNIREFWIQKHVCQLLWDSWKNQNVETTLRYLSYSFAIFYDTYGKDHGNYYAPVLVFNPYSNGSDLDDWLRYVGTKLTFAKNDKFNIRHYMDKYKSGTNTKTPTSKDSDFWGCFHAFTPRMKTGYQLSTSAWGTPDPAKELPGVHNGTLEHIYLYRDMVKK